MDRHYLNAGEAFAILYDDIMKNGEDYADTKALFNIGFYLHEPTDKEIRIKWRKWNKDYAEQEWQWYLSANPNAKEIAKVAKIWENCMDENGNVNSNYGYQWNRGEQLQYVIDELRRNPESRRASISIYDGKEHELYTKDTPCTQYINFYIFEDKLNMNVHMRSNDLVFGFCNDQYCFSKLQELIAIELNLQVGTYFHFANNLHIYPRHFNMKDNER